MQKTGLLGGRSAPEPSVQAAADDAFDIALQRLTEATEANEEVCTKVRRSQDSGTLKLVTVPPPAISPIAE